MSDTPSKYVRERTKEEISVVCHHSPWISGIIDQTQYVLLKVDTKRKGKMSMQVYKYKYKDMHTYMVLFGVRKVCLSVLFFFLGLRNFL